MSVEYAFKTRPKAGETQQIAEGIEWLRMPLPFSLNHINLWLLRDDDRWAIVDTGVGTEESIDVWQHTFATTMGNDGASHVIATHFDIDLWMSRDEYMLCRILVADTGRDAPA